MNKKHHWGIVVFLVIITFIYFGIKIYASKVAGSKLNQAIAKAVKIADIDYKKVSVDLIPPKVRISNVIITPVGTKEKIKIHEIIMRDVDDKTNIPTFLSMAIKGLELNVNYLGKVKRNIKELGYSDKLLVNLNLDYNYNPERKEFDLKKLIIGAEKVGEVYINLRIGNIDLPFKNLIDLISSLPEIIFYKAKIAYIDDSLINRLIKSEAKKRGISIKAYKKTLMYDMDQEIKRADDEFTQKALNEFKKFLEHPNKLSLLAVPSKPYPTIGRILRVNNPTDVIKLLDIKITS